MPRVRLSPEERHWDKVNRMIWVCAYAKGVTTKKGLGELLGIDYRTISGRLNLEHPWTLPELYKAKKVLGIEEEMI